MQKNKKIYDIGEKEKLIFFITIHINLTLAIVSWLNLL